MLLASGQALGQAPAPGNTNRPLPIDEVFLKSEFSLRYNLRMQELAEAEPTKYPLWREMAPGDYFTSIKIQRDSLPQCPGLMGLSISLTKTNQIAHPGGHVSTMTYQAVPYADDEQHFLLGIDAHGKIHYLSGDIYLDPLDEWLETGAGMAEMAKVRLRFLRVEDLKPIPASQGHYRFEAKSAVLKTKIIVDFQDANRFTIGRKSDPGTPLHTFGDWSMDP